MTSKDAGCEPDGVVTIIVGDGHRSNALGEAAWRHLADGVIAASQAPETRVIVVKGHGDTFTAGSDLTEWEDADLSSVERCFAVMEQCFETIEHVSVPVIAAVEGSALGAGCQLALSCDLVVAGSSAVVGMPIARLGILASPAFAARVSAKAGTAIAADLYLTGRSLRAQEAHACGLVARVVADGTAYEVAHRLAVQVGSLPSASLGAAKQTLLALSRPALETPPGRHAPTVEIGAFHSAVAAFVHRHDCAEAS
ncbi:enoyl-CoA hydratase/isomerase family protein [Leekyejoonella antrihumi]|uniref:Enoyl-CoA hydratase/isomerase family protein n=1 Tax=Leekyejoonella antrihumi TaxID=1660198 RepID=A0A563E3A3_9MICO|nr:enoyl-CoA hydratase/isomerase family protein [Leekyejoonella antrihumi]TWP36374.1 enoyl-CoA hydratase/isomerase family protein [Leekyejoonella antrihumi]